MDVFLSTDGDNVGAKVASFSLANDVDNLKIISSKIESANAMISSWVLASGGEVIGAGGDEVRAKIPVSKLSDLEQIRKQYTDLTGATLSMGCGMRINEADRALLASKLTGKDRVTFYSPQVEEIIQNNAKPETESEKINKEYGNLALNKEENNSKARESFQNKYHVAFEGHPYDQHPAIPAKWEGDPHAGIKGAHRPKAPLKAQTDSDDHEQGAEEAKFAQIHHLGQAKIPSTSQLAKQLHKIALKQARHDVEDSQKGETKAQILQILEEVKNAAPIIQELKQTAPEAYKAVTDSINAMLQMAKDLHKSEESSLEGSEESSIEHKIGQDDQNEVMEQDKVDSDPNVPETSESIKKKNKANEESHKKAQEEVNKADNLVQPPGSVDKGKLKILTNDGKTKWVGGRSGLILDAKGDPAGARK